MTTAQQTKEQYLLSIITEIKALRKNIEVIVLDNTDAIDDIDIDLNKLDKPKYIFFNSKLLEMVEEAVDDDVTYPLCKNNNKLSKQQKTSKYLSISRLVDSIFEEYHSLVSIADKVWPDFEKEYYNDKFKKQKKEILENINRKTKPFFGLF